MMNRQKTSSIAHWPSRAESDSIVPRLATSPADLVRPPREVPDLDGIAAEALRRRQTFTETELLFGLWATGEEARLDEDIRFIPLSNGRWRHRDQRLVNDLLVLALLEGWDGRNLDERLERLDLERGGRHIFDPADPRLRLLEDGSWGLARVPYRLRAEPLEGETCLPLLELQTAGAWLVGESVQVPRGWLWLESEPESLPAGGFLVDDEGILLLLSPETGSGPGLRRDGERFVLTASSSDEVLARRVRHLAPHDLAEFDLPDGRRRGPATDADLARRLESLDERRKRYQTVAEQRTPAPGERVATPELALSPDGQNLLVLLPVVDLPSDLRYVELEGTSHTAASFRSPMQVRVPAKSGVYRCLGRTFADEPRPLLDLSCPGLSAERATVFAGTSGGPGRRAASTTLRCGGLYRLVIPHVRRGTARRVVEHGCAQRLATLGEPSFDVLEVSVPSGEDTRLDHLLSRLGLSRAPEELTLQVGRGLPWRLEIASSGETLPVWDGSGALLLRAGSATAAEEGALQLLLAGPSGTARVPLPTGQEWEVELAAPDAGLWLVELRSRQPGVASAREAFLVEHPARGPAAIPAEWWVTLDGAPVQTEPVPRDLTQARLGLRLPPLGEIEVSWEGPDGGEPPRRLRATSDGTVDTLVLRSAIQAFLSREPVARVTFRASDLGEVTLLHEGLVDARSLVDGLRCLAAQADDDFDLRGFQRLSERTPGWILPVVQALGLRPDPSGEGYLLAAPTVRDGRPAREAIAWLLPVDTPEEVEARLQEAEREGRTRSLPLAVVTDGERWALQRLGRLRVPPEVHDLRLALEAGDDSRLMDFVREMAG